MGAVPVREEIPAYRARAHTQRAQHAQQGSDADQLATEAHFWAGIDDALLAVGRNNTATLTSKPTSAPGEVLRRRLHGRRGGLPAGAVRTLLVLIAMEPSQGSAVEGSGLAPANPAKPGHT